MAEFGQQISAFLQAYPDLKWLIVLAGLGLLILALYKLSFTQTIGQNGRVTTTYRVPFTLPAFLDKYLTLNRQSYKPWQIYVLKVLYSCQEFLFGVMLFTFGVILFAVGSVHALDGALAFFKALPLLTTFLGLIFMGGGVWLVTSRNLQNPFDDSDERQSL